MEFIDGSELLTQTCNLRLDHVFECVSHTNNKHVTVVNLHSNNPKRVFQFDTEFKTLLLLEPSNHVVLPYIEVTTERLKDYKKFLNKLNKLITFS
jgi:hypothetical protein